MKKKRDGRRPLGRLLGGFSRCFARLPLLACLFMVAVGDRKIEAGRWLATIGMAHLTYLLARANAVLQADAQQHLASRDHQPIPNPNDHLSFPNLER